MTDTDLSSADVLRGQLLDVLLPVPAITLARLDRETTFAIFDWCEAVKEAIAKMGRVPAPPKVLRGYMRPPQLAGEWSAFTTWRPAAPKKEQKGLFA